jgi:hypothetical protein
MANQVEIPKLVEYVATGVPAAGVGVSKLVMYVVGTPSDAVDTSNRQGHVHTQIITRSR